jgi:hypothetical protein
MIDYTPPFPKGAILAITCGDVNVIAEITSIERTPKDDYEYHLEEFYASDDEPTYWEFNHQAGDSIITACHFEDIASFKNKFPEYFV